MAGVWVLGGGGHAKVVVATLDSSGQAIAGIFDDDLSKTGSSLLSSSIDGPTPDMTWWKDERRDAFIAIGNNRTREKVAQLPATWVIAAHKGADIHATAQVGAGSLICSGVVIQPDSEIGCHVIANTACSIDHECKVGDFAHIAPGVTLAGEVTVGKRTLVGAGATIIQGVQVGADVTIGAGAVVISDVADGEKVAGVPARSLSND